MTVSDAVPTSTAVRSIETNGINVISDAERKGRPADLFWPWFGANVSVLGMAYGAYGLGFGISFWQCLVAGVLGIVISFLLCGLVSVAGKRGSAPTMVLSRAAFGVDGNRLPAVVSWMLTVGWETVLTILATGATATVFEKLGWAHGTPVKVVAMVVVAALIIGAGVLGFDAIMKLQTWITVLTGVLTVVFMILMIKHIHWDSVSAIKSGSSHSFIGALVFFMTGFGLGWVNAAADYSRYLPRTASARGIVWWTTFAASLAPIVLLVFGMLLAGSSAKIAGDIGGSDPIGALVSLSPKWFLVPFLVVAILGLVGGAVLDIYSSGLALLAAGIRLPRFAAAFIDGVVMVIGTIYVVFVASDQFFTQFQGFLYLLGVPIASWCGIMLADIALRHGDYAEQDLFTALGRYGSVRVLPVATMVVATFLGWGLITSSVDYLKWEGYLLSPFGLGDRDLAYAHPAAWAHSNLGVLVALVLSFVVAYLGTRAVVRTQESRPAGAAAATS